MPTIEEIEGAKLKAASADPLVWAMKSVDDKFPDEREKNAETMEAEAEVETKMGSTDAEKDEKVLKNETLEEELDDDFDDEELLDDSELLDDADESSNTKMIDELAAVKKAEKSEKEPEADEKKIEKDEKKLEKESPVQEIKAEDKLTMPTEDGVVTMEVKPMRQDVSNVSPEEFKKVPEEEVTEPEPKSKFKFKAKAKADAKSTDAKATDSKTQVKLMNLEFKQKKMMIGFAALAIVAAVGVCFGVIATVKQSQATEEFANQLAEASANNNGNDSGVDSEYINLKDWGVKIKIVNGLTNISYNTLMDDYAEVQIWGTKYDQGANYVPDFAKQAKNSTPLGTMVRVPRYERAAAGRLIWYDDYYNYYYQGPSGVPAVSEDEMSWWVESYLLVKEMLTNADNYTTE